MRDEASRIPAPSLSPVHVIYYQQRCITARQDAGFFESHIRPYTNFVGMIVRKKADNAHDKAIPRSRKATGDAFIFGAYFLITMPCVSRSATMPSTTACTSSRVRVRSAWEKKMRTVMDLPASSV